MPFFDLHVHPTLKTMFSPPDNKTSPWIAIDTRKINWFFQWCTDFASILGSQSNLKQMTDVGCDLACIALFVPERGFIDNPLLRKQAVRTDLREYLDPLRLNQIIDGRLRPYPDLVREDLDVLTHPERFGYLSPINYIFSVEGCHTLSSTLDPKLINKVEVLQNLDELSAEYPVMALNITHLEQYPFCNHAYGILFIASENFLPIGKEISAEGIDIIQHCYERNILIDLKHMSLGARRKFIEDIRQRPEFSAINQPLICTHAGFTGISYTEIPDYINYERVEGKGYGKILWTKPKKYQSFEMIAFNPSSINLYDEDIMAILRSGGIIGLSLDKRILGYAAGFIPAGEENELVIEEEFISVQEEQYFLTKEQLGLKRNEFHSITNRVILDASNSTSNISFYHLNHFMAHVLHLMVVAEKHGYSVDRALQQICIGSDFDGFINPLWCCPNATEFPAFKKDFIRFFPGYLIDNEAEALLENNDDIHLIADQLFYENGRNFVLQRLPLIQR